MSNNSLSPIKAPAIAFGLLALLAACGSESTNETSDANAQTQEEREANRESNTETQSSGGGGLDTLYAESSHEDVETAAPGTAYINIDGERLEFTGLECDVTEGDGGSAVQFDVEGETSYGLTKLSVLRGIGWDVGFEYEEELIQVTHLQDAAGSGSPARWSTATNFSMAQNSGDEDGTINWHRGDGPDPMLRIVGSDVTAKGTLTGLADSYGSEFEFTMAANCD